MGRLRQLLQFRTRANSIPTLEDIMAAQPDPDDIVPPGGGLSPTQYNIFRALGLSAFELVGVASVVEARALLVGLRMMRYEAEAENEMRRSDHRQITSRDLFAPIHPTPAVPMVDGDL